MRNEGDPGRLLVLDDEEAVAETVCMIGESISFSTCATYEIESFLEKVAAWQPTHIALDLQMPGRDGIEVLRTLAATDCDAAIIIISGLGGRILNSAARVAREGGLNLLGTLEKPFSRAQLRQLLLCGVSDDARSNSRSSSNTDLDVTRTMLEDALDRRAFVVHYQPKVSCKSGHLTGFECLARWPRGDNDFVPPDTFIPLAEQTGLIHELTRQVYAYAFEHFHHAALARQFDFALNLSPLNLKDPSFSDWLINTCNRYRIDAERIILEVTETASMDNPLMLLEHLTRFRIKGFSLSIDDFGVGYSSLVQLARLPFSEIKIDRQFVNTAENSEESRKIISAIVHLGRSLDLKIVAEGIENARTFHILRDQGCDEAQGYFISPPMRHDLLSDWASRFEPIKV